MHLSLLVFGVLVTMAGAAMVAFGIPINEFGLGNTLITAGTTAFVGGLILIALSYAVKQLRRIAESLMVRPGARASRTNDLFDLSASNGPRPSSGRVPFPPKPNLEARNRAPSPFESRLDAAPSIDTAEDHVGRSPAFERGHAPEPHVFPERDEAPLSPQAESRFAAAREHDDELSDSLLATAFSRLDVSLRPAPPPETPPQNELFESMWPAKPRPSKTTDAVPNQKLAEAEGRDPEESVEEPKDDAQPAKPFAVSILKSGVVDGMAYTLYSDGSIEAEMPQGTMRFASITELRAYLEKSS
jgi:hypothetical protein